MVRGVVGESAFCVSDSTTVKLATSGGLFCAFAAAARHSSASSAARARREAAMAPEGGAERVRAPPRTRTCAGDGASRLRGELSAELDDVASGTSISPSHKRGVAQASSPRRSLRYAVQPPPSSSNRKVEFFAMASSTAAAAEAPLCDYELQRLERIKRNRKARRRATACPRDTVLRMRQR
jgi:hypothetical protein